MFRQLKFKDRLTILAVAPLVVIAVVAAGLLIFLGTEETRPYGLFAAAGLAVAGAIAFLAGRSILSSINQLTDASAALAAAHRKLAAGEISADELEPIDTGTADHIGRLAASINSINAATVEISETQQGAVKAGLSNIVVNLARRSQTLLDRQVEYLDRLESSEEDPDRLSELFKVDHLATRMRRNAESLMVLAEADPGRRRGGPVEIGDVLRVAMGEVEIYQNIELSRVDQGQISATTAVDLAHLTAELMENATQFSPPNTPVDVSGQFTTTNKFLISIADQGIGLGEEKLAQTNDLLANPPELGLGMGRSLGFMVIGRLAQRLNATVTLESNGESGSKAVVAVPADLFLSRGSGIDGHIPAAEVAPNPPTVPTEMTNSTPPPLAAHERATGAAAAPAVPSPDAASLNAPSPAVAGSGSPSSDGSGHESSAVAASSAEVANPLAPSFDAQSFDAPSFDAQSFDAPSFDAPTVAGASPELVPEMTTTHPVEQSPAPIAEPQPADTAEPTPRRARAGSSALERLLGFNPAAADQPAPAPGEAPVDWASASPFDGAGRPEFQPEADGQPAHWPGHASLSPAETSSQPNIAADPAQPVAGDALDTTTFEPASVDPAAFDSPAFEPPAFDTPAAETVVEPPADGQPSGSGFDQQLPEAAPFSTPAAETVEFDSPFGTDAPPTIDGGLADQGPWAGWDQPAETGLPQTRSSDPQIASTGPWAPPDSTYSESAQPDSTYSESAQLDPTQPDSGRPDPAPPIDRDPIEHVEPEPYSYTEPPTEPRTGTGSGLGSWTPPEVTPGPPAKLEQAIPSGDAFETGVASLLNDPGRGTDPETNGERARPDNSGNGVAAGEHGHDHGARSLRSDDATSAGLVKRQRGASHVPVGEGRPVASSKRDPDEVRSRLSRYREGLKGRKPTAQKGNEPEQTDTRDR